MALSEITETSTYLTFTLDQEDFAVDVSGVREVLDFTTVTRVPRTPNFMKGVINLRGSVVPVVDMRLKFGLPEAEKTVDTCVIVLEVEMEGEVTVIGAIADSVKEVFELESKDIEPPPRLGTRFESEFISGMGKHNENFIIILDVNKVFSSEEMELFRQAEEDLPKPLPYQDKGAEELQKEDSPDATGGENAVVDQINADPGTEKPDDLKASASTPQEDKASQRPKSGKSEKSTEKTRKAPVKNK